MSRPVLAMYLLASLGSVSAQSGPSSLAGTISDSRGAAVAAAPIQVTNKATGAFARTSSKPDGRYSFASLRAGTYEISIAMPCCAYARFSKEVTIETGKAVPFDVQLIETINGSTLGDDPGRLADVMRQRAKVPSRPAPRAAGGKPDLSGVWIATDDPYPETPQLLPWAAALMKKLQEAPGVDSPRAHCLPGSPPVPASSTPWITKFVQTPALLVALYEDVGAFRQVFLDGRAHPANWDPTWLGHSLGRWEGDVLVVDTAGFNDRSRIGGVGTGALPHTEMLRLTERYRRVDFGHMELAVTYDDPGTFVKPLRMNVKFNLAPQEELLEYVCENNKPEHMVGK